MHSDGILEAAVLILLSGMCEEGMGIALHSAHRIAGYRASSAKFSSMFIFITVLPDNFISRLFH